MSDASGLSIEVSEKEESDFENMSTCDSPGPCLQNRQCPRQFMQHFPSMSLARDISDNESESSGKSVTSMVDGEIIKYPVSSSFIISSEYSLVVSTSIYKLLFS